MNTSAARIRQHLAKGRSLAVTERTAVLVADRVAAGQGVVEVRGRVGTRTRAVRLSAAELRAVAGLR